MADIVDLDEIVPDDIVFKLKGAEYALPGDLDSESVFKLMRLFSELTFEGFSSQSERSWKKLEAHLLWLFQKRQPEMETLPFGVNSLGVVTVKVLELLGIKVGGEGDVDVPLPTAEPPKKPSGSRSRRSSGSAASSTRTTGRRSKS